MMGTVASDKFSRSGSGRSIKAIRRDPGSPVDADSWPATVPAVAQILRDGLELEAGLTVLIGENGSGKSTVVEILAEACGLNPQGGSAGSQYQTRNTEPGLGRCMILEHEPGRHHWSYFLRADTMHGQYSYLENNPGRDPERFHELSHREGFLEVLRTRVNQTSLYLMDEPDAPLSFTASLGLLALLHDLIQAGSQAIVATNSPIIAAVPGAHILELGDWGIRPARWDELDIVTAWRRFMAEPQSYLRYLLDSAR
jgi:predicted ATPase